MHSPVLLDKVIEYLDPGPNENFVDCTAGAGGHIFAIAEKTAPKGKILALDWDTEAVKLVAEEVKKRKLQGRITIVNENFDQLQHVVQETKFNSIRGILFDLGFSSDQLTRKRGISFLKDEALDMRYSEKNPVTAEKLVNYNSRAELERILKEYGEEQFAKQIAAAIVEYRTTKPITKTGQLVKIIQEATPKAYQRKKIHAATKTFQALRIAVNDELENIRRGLQGAQEILPAGGKIAIISFHSLEDRIAKQFLKTDSFQQITKKPITPSEADIKNNPRARSAKLRVATKL
jgi:16S rRNA (cytosine1402-N4)-methyltransferase